MPRWDVHATRHHIVDAHVEETHDALASARLDDPLLRLLFVLSRFPARIRAHAQGRRPPDLPRRPTLQAMGWREDWIVLDERPPDETVTAMLIEAPGFGLPRMRRVAASDFDDFAQPGHVKVVTGFSLRPYGPMRTVLTMDVRALGTDPVTSRRVRVAWRLARPLAKTMMDRVLAVVERKAEHAPAPPAPPPPERHTSRTRPDADRSRKPRR